MNLWRIASCSSAPWLGSEDNSNDPPDVKVSAVGREICRIHSGALGVEDTCTRRHSVTKKLKFLFRVGVWDEAKG